MGSLYEYFSCINRRSRNTGGHCPSPHFPVALVEKAIEQHYRTVRLTARVRQIIREEVQRDASERAAPLAKRWSGTNARSGRF